MRTLRNREEQLQLAFTESLPIYFASGTNHPGEVRGFAELGQPMGTAVDECREPCLQAYEGLSQAAIPVFLDSGAFSEVKPKFRKGQFVGFEDVKPITPEEWRRRLDVYQRLGDRLGSLLYAVAPDKVGDQLETLRRLSTYREDVRELIDKGVNVIVPLQGGGMPGAMSLRDFDRKVQRILGTERYVVGFPMKKGATSPEVIEEFLRFRRPRRIHLLGLGEKNPNAKRILDLVREVSPGTAVSLDSVKVTAQVGWEYDQYKRKMEKLGVKPMPKSEWEPEHHLVLPGFRRVSGVGAPRPLTLARYFVTPIRPHWGKDLRGRHQRDLGLEEFGIEVLNDRDMVDRMDEWMTKELREEAMRQAMLNYYWNQYEDPDPDEWEDDVGPVDEPPPELPWYPIEALSYFPLPKFHHEDTEIFRRSPHEWLVTGGGFITHDVPIGSREWYRQWADMLRPMYLTALGKMKIPGSKRSTVQAAYGKRESIKAAFGQGPEAVRFRQWADAMRSVPSQKDWEMLVGLRYWSDPINRNQFFQPSPQEYVIAVGALTHPEFDEIRLRYWDQLGEDHWWLEAKRLEGLDWKHGTPELEGVSEKDLDDYGKYLAYVRDRFNYENLKWKADHAERTPAGPVDPKERKAMNEYLRQLVKARVERYRGGKPKLPAGKTPPKLAAGFSVPRYQVAPFWGDPATVAVANPRRMINAPRGKRWASLKRKLMQ